jgi:hypothetical protein
LETYHLSTGASLKQADPAKNERSHDALAESASATNNARSRSGYDQRIYRTLRAHRQVLVDRITGQVLPKMTQAHARHELSSPVVLRPVTFTAG